MKAFLHKTTKNMRVTYLSLSHSPKNNGRSSIPQGRVTKSLNAKRPLPLYGLGVENITQAFSVYEKSYY